MKSLRIFFFLLLPMFVEETSESATLTSTAANNVTSLSDISDKPGVPDPGPPSTDTDTVETSRTELPTMPSNLIKNIETNVTSNVEDSPATEDASTDHTVVTDTTTIESTIEVTTTESSSTESPSTESSSTESSSTESPSTESPSTESSSTESSSTESSSTESSSTGSSSTETRSTETSESSSNVTSESSTPNTSGSSMTTDFEETSTTTATSENSTGTTGTTDTTDPADPTSQSSTANTSGSSTTTDFEETSTTTATSENSTGTTGTTDPADTTDSTDITDTTDPADTTDSTGTTYTTETTTDSSEGGGGETEENGVNVGLIIGIILAILVVGIAVVLWRARQSGRLLWPPQKFFSNGLSDSVRPQPVPLKKFPSHCSEMLDVPSKLSYEYQLLATLSVDIAGTESFVAGQLPDNKYKNRYVNILPYDSTRVKLAPEGDDFYSDYVNASYIKGYTNEIEYIATQGPKEETCRDFWKMVYQEPIKVIIMVTQLEEQGKPKCYKYFPNLRENIVLEDIIVRCTTELHFPIYTSRTLILTKGERKRSIIHLHFREWPDFGCPATPDLMLQFCQVMRHNIILAQPGITLIHCSAGVGRTGTLIAVDILLQHVKDSKKIDIFGTVYKLRKHRMNMVQSEAQYVYIYKCVKEALEDPSYLSSENSSTTSLEPIYENIECTRLSSPSSKIVQDTVISESECAL